MVLGKYGIRQIPTGFRMVGEYVEENEVEEQADAETSAPRPPAGKEFLKAAAEARPGWLAAAGTLG